MPNLRNVAFIGSIQLHGFHGRMPSPQKNVDDYARVGATGSGSQIVGTRGRLEPIEPWVGAPSATEAKKLADDLEALQGSVVRMQDDFGRVFERVRIKTISASIKSGLGNTLPSGSQMTHLIRINATVEVLP